MLRTSTRSNNKIKSEINYLSLFYHICGIALCITIIYFALASIWLGPPKSVAELGDMFGFIGAIFAALAFAGVVVTIVLQQQELKETREELAKAAKAQDESQKALNEQLKSMQLSTRINVLQSYKNSLDKDSHDDAGKFVVVNKILLQLARNILLDDEHSNITGTSLECKSEKIIRGVKNKLFGYNFSLTNVGGPITITPIGASFVSTFGHPFQIIKGTVQPFLLHPSVSLFFSCKDSSDLPFECDLLLKNEISSSTSLLKLTIKIKGDNAIISLNEK